MLELRRAGHAVRHQHGRAGSKTCRRNIKGKYNLVFSQDRLNVGPLPGTLADVVPGRHAEDIIRRLSRTHVYGTLADHDNHLCFVMEIFGSRRSYDVLTGAFIVTADSVVVRGPYTGSRPRAVKAPQGVSADLRPTHAIVGYEPVSCGHDHRREGLGIHDRVLRDDLIEKEEVCRDRVYFVSRE